MPTNRAVAPVDSAGIELAIGSVIAQQLAHLDKRLADRRPAAGRRRSARGAASGRRRPAFGARLLRSARAGPRRASRGQRRRRAAQPGDGQGQRVGGPIADAGDEREIGGDAAGDPAGRVAADRRRRAASQAKLPMPISLPPSPMPIVVIGRCRAGDPLRTADASWPCSVDRLAAHVVAHVAIVAAATSASESLGGRWSGARLRGERLERMARVRGARWRPGALNAPAATGRQEFVDPASGRLRRPRERKLDDASVRSKLHRFAADLEAAAGA